MTLTVKPQKWLRKYNHISKNVNFVKENIDSMSSYFVTLRNRYNIIPVVVQQLNRAMSSADRFKLKRYNLFTILKC